MKNLVNWQNLFVYGLNPCAKILWSGATDFAKTVVTVVTGLGAEAASMTQISAISIPITIVSTVSQIDKELAHPR